MGVQNFVFSIPLRRSGAKPAQSRNRLGGRCEVAWCEAQSGRNSALA